MFYSSVDLHPHVHVHHKYQFCSILFRVFLLSGFNIATPASGNGRENATQLARPLVRPAPVALGGVPNGISVWNGNTEKYPNSDGTPKLDICIDVENPEFPHAPLMKSEAVERRVRHEYTMTETR